MTFTDLQGYRRTCLPPKTKPERKPENPPRPEKPFADSPAKQYLRGMDKINAFIARASIYVLAKFPRKKRDENGKVLSVSLV